jgi:hypothetical protein
MEHQWTIVARSASGRRGDINEKAAWWRSGRLRQLGKSSQPIEAKWADFAPVGKKAV